MCTLFGANNFEIDGKSMQAVVTWMLFAAVPATFELKKYSGVSCIENLHVDLGVGATIFEFGQGA